MRPVWGANIRSAQRLSDRDNPPAEPRARMSGDVELSMSQHWHELAKSLTEETLLLRLKGNEHDFVERKPRGQKGDWLQVAVAFANSAPIGWPAFPVCGGG